MHRMVASRLPRILVCICLAGWVPLVGCSSERPVPADSAASLSSEPNDSALSESGADATDQSSAETAFEPPMYEATAEQLLASRLPAEEAAEGWVRLFDGHTFFGWAIAGKANWRIKGQAIIVDDGSPCLLTTNSRWADFELKCDYMADQDTDSGVFLRTVWQPTVEASDSIEVNLAPGDESFPSGSLDRRPKSDLEEPPEVRKWHSLHIVCQGNSVHVRIDGQTTCRLESPDLPRQGAIGLQYQSGRIAFRDIRLREFDYESLLDEELSQWERSPEMDGEFRVDPSGALVVDGGKQQLESVEQFGDFTLLAEYRMKTADSNSGLFFRCIPGQEMMGYECQINDEQIGGNPLEPADGGTGGIFRRQDARIVAGQVGQANTVVLTVRGPHFASWVNGVQVSDVTDGRPPEENPRRGLRLAPGTLMVQGHDETTWVEYRQLAVAEFP